MTDDSPKKANNYLEANHQDLQYIFTKVKMLEELNAKVSAYLDERLKKSCQVANVNGGILVLIVANGSVATQLRFQIPDLLKKFKLDPILKRIHDIQCKVRPAPSSSRVDKASNTMPTLSPESAQIMRDIITMLQLK